MLKSSLPTHVALIRASAGIGLWILGITGLMPNGEKYALIFGVWAGITELIPYIGPWLGAAPPIVYALVQDPISALWVALLFLGIQQLEGHIVVPKVMGHSLRLHPLLVIFGLLAGHCFLVFATGNHTRLIPIRGGSGRLPQPRSEAPP